MILTRRLSTVRSASTVYVQPNWLEKNCGHVPVNPQPQDSKASEMLRRGHTLQIASAKMLQAQVNTSYAIKTSSSAHRQKLKEMHEAENKAVQRIEEAVRTKDFRFRPSLVVPAVELSSFIVGSVLSVLGDTIRTSYAEGVTTAVSDYYNDQIRELYASKPEMVELKELFKVARDEELKFLDAHALEVTNLNDNNSDPVATVAKASLKVLAQVTKYV